MKKNQENKAADPIGRVVSFFSSVKLTVIILGLVAVFSLAGMMGYVEDIYHTRYFQALLGLLFINLLVCTSDRVPAALKRIKLDSGPEAPPPPREPDFIIKVKGRDSAAVLAEAEKIAFGSSGVWAKREVEQKGKPPATASFRSAGAWSALGPHITHLGILVLIIGAIIGGRYSFEGMMWLKPGQTGDMVGTKLNQPVPLDFSVRCNDFKIVFYENSRAAKDYLCDLTIIDNGVEKERKIIELNNPLYYNGFGIYQSQYQSAPMIRLTALTVADGTTTSAEISTDDPWTLPGTSIEFDIIDYEANAQGMGQDVGPRIVVRKSVKGEVETEFSLFERFPSFDKMRKDEYIFTFKVTGDFYMTGLRVSKDPGVPVVWAGSLIMILGIMVTFVVHHRRCWLIAEPFSDGVNLVLIGRSKKAQALFKNSLRDIAGKLRDGLSGELSEPGGEGE